MSRSPHPVPGETSPADRWSLHTRRLYLCTPDRPDLTDFLAACIGGGVDIVQLRDKVLPEHLLVQRAELAQRVCADHGVPFILNDRPDLAAALGADGVHVGQDDMTATDARRLVGAGSLVGLSTHSVSDLDAALGAAPGDAADTAPDMAAVPVDYLSAGPVVATPTKPGRPGTGFEYVRTVVDRSRWPVWITGGVTPESVGALIDVGARHFVVVRWLTEAADPRGHARALRTAIDAAIEATPGSPR